jgi:hypothetical protein
LQSENTSWARTIYISGIFGGALFGLNDSGVCEGAKKERVHDAALVGLTADELAQGSPNLHAKSELVLLSPLLLV